MGGTGHLPCVSPRVPGLVPKAAPCPSLARPCAEPRASSPGSGCGAGGSVGAHPAALSACSNLGRSWTWRSFSMSGAPRWVLPAAGAVTASPGEGARWSWDAGGLLRPLSPPHVPRGTQARGTPTRGSPVPLPCTRWGGPCRSLCPERRREGRAGSAPPCTGSSYRSVCGCLCCIFPAFCAPLPDSSPSSRAMLGPQPGPPEPAGALTQALHLCTAAASSPAPALLIHPLSLSVPTPSLCLSLSLSFLLFSSAHRVLGL